LAAGRSFRLINVLIVSRLSDNSWATSSGVRIALSSLAVNAMITIEQPSIELSCFAQTKEAFGHIASKRAKGMPDGITWRNQGGFKSGR
jgi:hypothetical protein